MAADREHPLLEGQRGRDLAVASMPKYAALPAFGGMTARCSSGPACSGEYGEPYAVCGCCVTGNAPERGASRA